MPELPEVETTCRGIRPHVEGRVLSALRVRNPRLRVPLPADAQAGEQVRLYNGTTLLFSISLTQAQVTAGTVDITIPSTMPLAHSSATQEFRWQLPPHSSGRPRLSKLKLEKLPLNCIGPPGAIHNAWLSDVAQLPPLANRL